MNNEIQSENSNLSDKKGGNNEIPFPILSHKKNENNTIVISKERTELLNIKLIDRLDLNDHNKLSLNIDQLEVNFYLGNND